jgi:putative hemolysin
MNHAADLPLLNFDVLPQQQVRFSYSRPDDSLLKKAVIRGIELFTGQPQLKRAYKHWSLERSDRENIFSAGVNALGLELVYDANRFSQIPASGPLLVVANHPFGVADGLAIGALMTRVRDDVKIMTHSLLCQPPEAANYLLPVDFGGTRAAKLRSADTRSKAVDWLEGGHCLIIFPAGGVATRQKPISGRALDLPWHTFAARLASVNGARVLPLYFPGENSTLFHLASHSWYPLRAALLFRETMRRTGRALNIAIGAPIDGAELRKLGSREAIVRHLRSVTFALQGSNAAELSREYVWPKWVKC